MQTRTLTTEGFLKSSVFSTLMYCNFFLSACFIIILAAEGVQNAAPPKMETVQQKPLQQSISSTPVTLASMQ